MNYYHNIYKYIIDTFYKMTRNNIMPNIFLTPQDCVPIENSNLYMYTEDKFVISSEELFSLILRWLNNLWEFMNKIEDTSLNLNIKAYGGYLRYMLTKKGSFNDLDLFVDNNFDKDINKKIETLLKLLIINGFIGSYTINIFTNFDIPLINYRFKIMMKNKYKNIVSFDAELLSGKPYNSNSRIDFVLNNFTLGKDKKVEQRIIDCNILNNDISVISSDTQEFLLNFNEPSELTTISEHVSELFKLNRLILMYNNGYNIICKSRIPVIINKCKNTCAICNNKSGYQIILMCGHIYHPQCIFNFIKNKSHLKGLCPSCNYNYPIKLKLKGTNFTNLCKNFNTL